MILADSGEVPEIQPPMPWDLIPWPYLVVALVVLVLLAVVTGLVRRSLPGARRAPILSLRWRAKLRIHPGPGWVGGWERWRSLGLPAARKVARVNRPSLSWWDRRRPFGWREYATHIVTTWGWVIRRRVVATGEDVVLTIAGPRRGKSAASAARIIDAPGKVLATSIRDDALKSTIGPRSEKGSIYIWNPESIGTYGSNMRWNPVAGCEDAQVAIRRAGYMVESQSRQGLSDAGFWSDQASVALAGLLHAAALAGYTMDHVYSWSLATDDTPMRILRQAKHANTAQRDDIVNFLEAMPERTKGSVATTLRNTLQFMRSPEIADMLSPRTDGRAELEAARWFDVTEFITSTDQDTLYLVSAGDDGTTAPLFSALIAEMAYTIRYGSANSGGHLDPPLDMELDEIANIAPIPVHQWVSWMAGCGIRIRIYAQTWSQLVDKYRGLAESIWACSSMKVIYGGVTEEALLKKVSTLAGTVKMRGKDQVHYSHDRDGSRVKEKTPTYVDAQVLPASELKLPRHWAVVFSTDVSPTLVSTPKAWKRRDVRRWKGRTPDCVVAPQQRVVPEVDLGLRQRVEQEDQGEQVQPLRVVATGTGGPADPVEEPPTTEAATRSGAEPTQPMESASLRDFVRRTAPKDTSAPAPSHRPASSRARDRGPRADAQDAPPLRRQPEQASGPRPDRLHPTPWDLPRSEPTPPDAGEQQQEEPPPRAGRLPWDDWEQ